MIVFSANTRKATATTDDAITTRSVGIPVSLVLSSEFDGLAKTLCAKNGTAAVDVVLVGDAVNAVLPPDVLLTTGQLQIGIYAADDEGNIVIPTVWALVGQVKQGAMPSGVDPLAPSPSWVAQVQNIASEAIKNSEQAIETANDAKEAAITAQDSAQASASAAAQSSADARNSANAAAGSATDASESADAAAGSASTASTKAGEAAASATTASGAAATATTQAGNASDSAAAAAQSASEAEASTETASTKAGEASASATAAAGSAATAAQTASEAAQSATQAANSASSASTSATAAGMAQTGAETAQTAAETAAQSVSASAAQIQQNANDITDLKSAVDEVEKSLETDYAKVDGYYDEMAVGSAEQLISTVLTKDSVPYNFRTSGGSADIGNRETDMVVGGTVVWNQQCITPFNQTVNGMTFTRDASRKTITMNGTTIYTAYKSFTDMEACVIGHVYFVDKGSDNGDFWIYNDGGGVNTKSNRFTVGKSTNTKVPYIRVAANVTFDNLSITPMWCDLTQMFGPTIADYIYGLETAEAGAGVAFFRKLFPKDYYEYNPGELMSVKTSAHEMVGFNQWDEEWEVGAYNGANGAKVASNDRIRSKNKIAVVPNIYYFVKAPYNIQIYEYGADGAFLRQRWSGSSNTRILISSDAHYITFNGVANSGTTYNHDICINLSWSGYRNGEYEPYEKHSYALDDSLELRGIPKLSADNELYYDGDTYASDGTVTRKYGIVDLGTLTWSASTGAEHKFYANSSGAANKLPYAFGTDVKMICSRYAYTGMRAQVPYFGEDKTIQAYPRFIDAGVSELYVHDSAYTDVSSFAAAMSGVYLVYELATPTTEIAEPFTNPQIVNDFGTEEYVDYAYEQGLRDVKIPVGHVTEYQANLRDKLQHLPDLADSDGNYLIQQTGNQMVLARFRIPQAPTTDGTYTLKATVSGGTPTYVWVDDSATPEEADT